MSDLIFNPNKNNFGNKYYGNNREIPKSKLAEWIIKLSGGKINEQKANYIMLGILIITVLITAAILYFSFSNKRNQELIPHKHLNYTE